MDFKTRQTEALSGWFSKGDCKVKEKAIEEDDMKAVAEEYVTVKHEFAHNPVTNRLERVEWTEEDSVQKTLALGARLILEWENVEIDGEPVECTDENKRILLGKSVEFREFYTEAINGITAQVRKDFGGAEPSKNSKSTRRKKLQK